jgi:nitrate reductase delta subunit
MGLFSTLAEALRYPAPGLEGRLAQAIAILPAGQAKAGLRTFMEQIEALSLGEWEELYTRTWDLNPISPPYIGFQIWGEDYRRGNFMARLSRMYRETGIETSGELADHLVPVLLYLEIAAEPPDELAEVFGLAVRKMVAVLSKRDPSNPYLEVLKTIPLPELNSDHLNSRSQVEILEQRK